MEQFKLHAASGAQWFHDNINCHAACPVGTEAFAYVTALAEGDHELAYAIARRPNPFPYICGRVCAHPCEDACRRGDIDEPISIRALKRTATDSHDIEPRPCPRADAVAPARGSGRRGRVGPGGAGVRPRSGPIGIPGHDVRGLVGARRDAGPGNPRVSPSPPDRRAGDRRDHRHRRGTEVQPGPGAGFPPQGPERPQGFRAVFLAIGAHRSKDLRIEGLGLDGVLRGVEFLLNVNLGYRVWLGHKVVVIGGGNVAVDVARTAAREGTDQVAVSTTLDAARAALRLGSREVHVICLESRERDAGPRLRGGRGGKGRESSSIPPPGPKRVLGVDGKVTGLETVRCLSVFDSDGRFNPSFAAGFGIAADHRFGYPFGRPAFRLVVSPPGGRDRDDAPRDDGHRSPDPGDHRGRDFCGGRRRLRSAFDHRRHGRRPQGGPLDPPVLARQRALESSAWRCR